MAIARWRCDRLAETRAGGCIPLLPPAARDGLSRPEQYEAVERFLETIAGVRG